MHPVFSHQNPIFPQKSPTIQILIALPIFISSVSFFSPSSGDSLHPYRPCTYRALMSTCPQKVPTFLQKSPTFPRKSPTFPQKSPEFPHMNAGLTKEPYIPYISAKEPCIFTNTYICHEIWENQNGDDDLSRVTLVVKCRFALQLCPWRPVLQRFAVCCSVLVIRMTLLAYTQNTPKTYICI